MMLMEAHANYDGELARLKAKKLRQTKEKIEKEGILDEDDYGRIVPREGVWRIIPNHADGSFYGFDAWTGNFCSLMDVHQVYVDPDDALAGRWCYFMSKMRPNKWNPDYPYDHLRERIERYDIIHGIGDDAHFAPDYEMGLRLGWGGLLDKIARYRAVNGTAEQQHFYDLHERAVYELVAGRMLEAFSGKCVKDVTTALLSGGDTDFTVKGSVMKEAGWRAVFGEQETGGDEEAASLPPLQEGECLPLSGVDLLEKQTKPKPLHTESSLLSAMENAGRELEDAELKASLKDAGIGTPATRAAIIETLFARQYIVREKKNLVPTDKGLAVYGIVKDKKIADVEMTGMWETALAKIEAGSMDADTFRKGIEVYATQITAELLSVQLSVATGETCPCPKCGSGRILFYPKVAKCSNVDCTLTIFRNKCDKQLSDKQIVELVTKRKTGLIKGFKGKNGKAFDASLVLDEQFNVGFSFPEKKAKPKK